MFWRILKNDLRRKKVLNVITLLFVILCAMFASASANNVAAVTRGIDHYFDLAEVPDLIVYFEGENDAEERIRALPSVSEVTEDTYLCVFGARYFKYRGEALDNFINPAFLYSDAEMRMRYFDADNRVIRSVPAGCFYATSTFTNGTGIRAGDAVTLEIGETTLTLKYLGPFKGALFETGTAFSRARLLLHAGDYEVLDREPEIHAYDSVDFGRTLFVKTSDPEAVLSLIENDPKVSASSRADFKGIYVYDMVTAYIMMAISILLMLISFVVLRFAIGFTISEEFREIGVMKAIGIDNGSIRRLYLVKYLAIAVIGAALGFLCAIPLGKVMLKTASENMVLSSGSSQLIGLISALAVVLVILLFCYRCTRSVRKFSPIDAVRNGQTGERFRRKSRLRLGRSRLPSTAFLAANDVLSAPRQFGIITAVFTLCLLLMIVLSCSASTLKSEKCLQLMNIPSGDAHVLDTRFLMKIFDGPDGYQEAISDMEALLAENGMPGRCSITVRAEIEAAHGDRKTETHFFVTKGYTEAELRVDEGSLPRKADEIILTKSVTKALGVGIGDRITAQIDGRTREFLVTGVFSSFLEGACLHRDFDFGEQQLSGCQGLQILFDGDRSPDTVRAHIEALKDLLKSGQIYSSAEFVKVSVGISDTLNSIKLLMMLLTVVVTAMITVLMERSFISKEKSEIAFMKAAGFTDGAVIGQHTLRFVLVSLLASLIAGAVGIPVSNAVLTWICGMPDVGDVSRMTCDFDPPEVFLFCPAILIGVTAAGAFLTALYTKKIKANDTASIE